MDFLSERHRDEPDFQVKVYQNRHVQFWFGSTVWWQGSFLHL